MSPKRSTRETDERQRRAAERYARAHGLHVEGAPGGTYAPVDYVARASARYGADVEEVIEVKCRDALSGSFRTVWLEESKVHHLRRWAGIYSARGVFLVEWGDGRLFWINVEDAVRAAGLPVVRSRKDRDDPRDTDIVYEVPVSAMREVLDGAGRGSGEDRQR